MARAELTAGSKLHESSLKLRIVFSRCSKTWRAVSVPGAASFKRAFERETIEASVLSRVAKLRLRGKEKETIGFIN